MDKTVLLSYTEVNKEEWPLTFGKIWPKILIIFSVTRDDNDENIFVHDGATLTKVL